MMVNQEKYIGFVKWFKDLSRDANYGFIQHEKLGDLFFHEKNLSKQQNPNLITANAIVVFNVIESTKHRNKFEALNVSLINNETDASWLLGFYLQNLLLPKKSPNYSQVQREVYSKILKIIACLNSEEKKSLHELIVGALNSNDNTDIFSVEKLAVLKMYLKVSNDLFPEKCSFMSETVKHRATPRIQYTLWHEGLINTCPVNYITENINSVALNSRIAILSRCTEEDKSLILRNLAYSYSEVDISVKLKSIVELLSLVKSVANSLYNVILEIAESSIPTYHKLLLWLDGYYNVLNFYSYRDFIITLSAKDQKRFVKKVLQHIHTGGFDVNLEDLLSINTMDYDTSKLIENSTGFKIDYSVSIMLNLISELRSNDTNKQTKHSKERQKRLYDIILKQIQDPKDTLEITGFFDSCEGRCAVNISETKNELGEVVSKEVSFVRNEKNKAKNHPICDGRKAINQINGEPLLSKEQVEYWWCANQKCYSPSRKLHTSHQWEHYSIMDFLTILNIGYSEHDLEIYLNIINKANRFLKHLKCRECESILYPKGKSEYAFYGVSNFCCNNISCTQKDLPIYISHCLNGYCETEIDSRDNVKCIPPNGKDKMCGWYICNNCNSCCSTKQLLNRKNVYDTILFRPYNCHTVGHKDLGIICCNKCGSEMRTNTHSESEYSRILGWFVSNKDSNERIYKSGKNSKDKWWFVLKRGKDSHIKFKETLNRYLDLGFQVPDIDEQKDLQLISEPLKNRKISEYYHVCINCNHEIDFANDFERLLAVQKFHSVKFQTIERSTDK